MFDRMGAGGEGRLLGDILALCASVSWAAIALMCRATPLKKSSPEMQLLYQLTVSAIVLLPLSFLFGEQLREMTTTLAWIFAFQVVVVVAFGFSLWFWKQFVVMQMFVVFRCGSFCGDVCGDLLWLCHQFVVSFVVIYNSS